MRVANALAEASALGLTCELCLVLALCGSTEHNLFGRRVNSIQCKTGRNILLSDPCLLKCWNVRLGTVSIGNLGPHIQGRPQAG